MIALIVVLVIVLLIIIWGISSYNSLVMLRNKGISDAVGNHSLNGFLVPAGHNDIRGNARFFKDRLVDHADSLALAADDKGVMIHFCNMAKLTQLLICHLVYKVQQQKLSLGAKTHK